MKINFKIIRKLHKWPGVLFLFPAIIISITAILLAFEHQLKLDKIKIKTTKTQNYDHYQEIKAILIKDSVYYIGLKNGLVILINESLSMVPELKGNDIRAIYNFNDTIFIASKQGLYKNYQNKFIKIVNNDVHTVFKHMNNLIICTGKDKIKITDLNGNSINDSLNTFILQKLSNLKQEKQYMSLQKLIINLHTGEAIVGKNLKPFWITFCGLQLLLLAITGLWFVLRKNKKQTTE